MERLEGEVMHHHGAMSVALKLWGKYLEDAQLCGMIGTGWTFCPEGLCYTEGIGLICAKDSLNREKRSEPVWF